MNTILNTRRMLSIVVISLIVLMSPVHANDDPSAWSHPNISQAVFAQSVKARIPQNIMTMSDNSLRKVYFFTNIRNFANRTIYHRWLYQGRVMAEVMLPIGNSQRWRTWSSKNLWYKWLGTWTVQVVDDEQTVMLEQDFYYYDQAQ